MLIDEAGNMPLEWLPEVSSTCAGIGIQLVTVWQSLAQIHESYGRRADILLTNHATKLFFPGASDDSTLSYQSKIVGDEDVERRSWSTDVAGGSARRSISGQDNREALVPYFLARLPRFGQALMIHSNTPPAQITGRQWWRIPRLARMVPHATPPRRRLGRRPKPAQPGGSGPWVPTEPRPAPSPPRPPAAVDAVTGEIDRPDPNHDTDAAGDAADTVIEEVAS
jgi:type IV secretory pathway TraG/TraD family ATPase VirD4